MDKKQVGKLEKLLYYVLALRPDEFGLVPDRDGWISFKELARAVQEEPDWSFMRPAHVKELVLFHAPERFEVDNEGERARAAAADSALREPWRPQPSMPPKTLFMAVRRRAYPHILEKGMMPPQGSDFLVGASSEELAMRIGRRKDQEPILIRIDTARLSSRGEPFLSSHGHLFLLRFLPAEAISGPPLPKQEERRPTKKKEKNPFAGLTVEEILSPASDARKERHGRKGADSWKEGRRRKKKDGWL